MGAVFLSTLLLCALSVAVFSPKIDITTTAIDAVAHHHQPLSTPTSQPLSAANEARKDDASTASIKSNARDAAAIEEEAAAAKRAAAAAKEQHQQRQLQKEKEEEAAKKEAAAVAEEKKRTASLAKPTQSPDVPKKQQKQQPTTKETATTIVSKLSTTSLLFNLLLSRVSTLHVELSLFTIEVAFLIVAACLFVRVLQTSAAAEAAQRQYLAAYRQQRALLARAHDVYEEATLARSTAEKILLQARESSSVVVENLDDDVDLQGESSINDTTKSTTTTTTEEHEREHEEQQQLVRIQQLHEAELKRATELEKKVEEAQALAAAEKSAWAATAVQILQLVAASPIKRSTSGASTNSSAGTGTTTTTSASSSPSRPRHPLIALSSNENNTTTTTATATTPPSPNTLTRVVADRCSQLQSRATAAEAAAIAAAAAAECARREREYSDQKASEVLTDCELLKERLQETKNALTAAEEASTAAQSHERAVRQTLEATQRNLDVVSAEKMALIEEHAALQSSLAVETEKVAAAEKSGERREGEMELLTIALADEAAQKLRAEQRCAQLEADVSALQILAEGLEGQKETLEKQLAASLTAQEDLKTATLELEAAHAAVAASVPLQLSSIVAQQQQQQQMDNEPAEKKRATAVVDTTTTTTAAGASLLQTPRTAAPESVSPHTTSSAYQHQLQQQNQKLPGTGKKALSFIARAGQIANMLSEEMEDFSLSPLSNGTPTAAATTTHRMKDSTSNTTFVDGSLIIPPLEALLTSRGSRRTSISSVDRHSNSPFGDSLSAKMARASELFSAAEQYLGSTLPQQHQHQHQYQQQNGDTTTRASLDFFSSYSPRPAPSTSTSISHNNTNKNKNSSYSSLRPYTDIPSLLQSTAAALGGATSSSSTSSTPRSDDAMVRLTKAVKESTAETEALLPSLAALATADSTAASVRVSTAQGHVSAALAEVETAVAVAAQRKEEYRQLTAVARERQKELEDAQLALAAAQHEGAGDNTNEVVASVAQSLEAVEAAQKVAVEAVYQAEREMYKAVQSQLAARDALRKKQLAMEVAVADATTLLIQSNSPTAAAAAAAAPTSNINRKVVVPRLRLPTASLAPPPPPARKQVFD